jgi:antitoxin CptB
MTKLGKLRLRCRRGMKELDVLLARYLDRHGEGLTPDSSLTLERLLEQTDPDLYRWLLGSEDPSDPALAHLVRTIRETPAS